MENSDTIRGVAPHPAERQSSLGVDDAGKRSGVGLVRQIPVLGPGKLGIRDALAVIGHALKAEVRAVGEDGGQHGLRVGVDLALDVEQSIDASDRLKGDRRDDRGLAARLALSRLSDVGQLEDLAPAMRLTQGLADIARIAASPIQGVVAAIGVGLQDAGPSGEMVARMLSAAIARIVEGSATIVS